MEEDETVVRVAVTESGEQIVMTGRADYIMGISAPGDPVVREVQTEAHGIDLAELQKLALTNDIPSDMLKDIEDLQLNSERG